MRKAFRPEYLVTKEDIKNSYKISKPQMEYLNMSGIFRYGQNTLKSHLHLLNLSVILLVIMIVNGHMLRTSNYSNEYLETTMRFLHFAKFLILYL